MSSVYYYDPYVFWDCENLIEIVVVKNQGGFPVKISYDSQYYSLDSQIKISSNGYSVRANYLQKLKRIIIEDSDEDFSIKVSFTKTNDGFQTIPAFSKIDLDYFYVGRPLIDIDKTSYIYFTFQGQQKTGYVSVAASQGYGHIKTLEIGGQCTDVPYFYQKIDTLKLGKNTATFDMSNIYFDDLTTIICKSEIPPKTSNVNNIASSNYLRIKILVPPGCKDVYSKSPGWENFWNIEESEELSGVDSVNDSVEKTVAGRYDLSGKSVDENYKGMVIVRFSDGSTKKMFQ